MQVVWNDETHSPPPTVDAESSIGLEEQSALLRKYLQGCCRVFVADNPVELRWCPSVLENYNSAAIVEKLVLELERLVVRMLGRHSVSACSNKAVAGYLAVIGTYVELVHPASVVAAGDSHHPLKHYADGSSEGIAGEPKDS